MRPMQAIVWLVITIFVVGLVQIYCPKNDKTLGRYCNSTVSYVSSAASMGVCLLVLFMAMRNPY